jgi:hypothetical protein
VRGSKAKQLRREYRERYGEAPQKSDWRWRGQGWDVGQSVWRALKTLYKKGELK